MGIPVRQGLDQFITNKLYFKLWSIEEVKKLPYEMDGDARRLA